MIQLLSDILQAAGVTAPLHHDINNDDIYNNSDDYIGNSKHDNSAPTSANKNDDDDNHPVIVAMEVWLGLRQGGESSDSLSKTTVEDCLPLSDDVARATMAWLIEVWDDRNVSSSDQTTSNDNGNAFTNDLIRTATVYTNLQLLLPKIISSSSMAPPQVQGNTCDNQKTSAPSFSVLESAIPSIRATKYVRTWMELNCMVNDDTILAGLQSASDSPDDVCSQLSRRLLSTTNESSIPKSTVTTIATTAVQQQQQLIQALFYHVQNLPTVQQQILAFTQHIQQPPQKGDGRKNGGSASFSSTLMAVNTDEDRQQLQQQLENRQGIVQQVQQEWQDHLNRIEYILGDFYTAAPKPIRCSMRQQLGNVWTNFIRYNESLGMNNTVSRHTSGASMQLENTKAVAIRLTLNVLRRILLGMSTITSLSTSTNSTVDTATVRHHLLFVQLLQLHNVNGVLLWRDQTSILELYHEPLCQCIAIIIQQELRCTNNHTTIMHQVIQQLLQQPNIFPKVGSTSKQVLLLHEIETYLRLIPSPQLINSNEMYNTEVSKMLLLLFQTLGRCMASEHSRIAERALQFFQSSVMDVLLQTNDDHAQTMIDTRHNNLSLCIRILLPALIRKESSWNPTVRKMTYHVVNKIQSYDETLFVSTCNEIFANQAHEGIRNIPAEKVTKSKLFTDESSESSKPDLSLTTGMGDWRPPSTSSLPKKMNNRGIPGRGTAPWASDGSQSSSVAKSSRLPTAMVGKSNMPPPSTITGVAPWAIQPKASTLPMRTDTSPNTKPDMIDKSCNTELQEPSDSPMSGYEYVLANLDRIKPPLEEEGVSSWSQAQMAEVPTLLPNLKFHDLVFGHDLGSGAFGSVRYARLIDKKKSRSQWSEYAVKIVSTDKIREMGYEASIQREIAVLHLMSHPGIARLVSSFRFNDGAYLVLEYASRGDLHNLLQKHGSLDIDSTRFVVGEVVAALSR
jgi:Protein kinase domain/Protein phosphatase 2A regulatory B subunit (B56 family)